MAQFNPSRKFPTDFNKGNKYKAGDAVQASTINNLVESALWVQDLAFGDAIVLGDVSYEVEVSSTSTDWQQVNGKWSVRILQTTHNFKKIHSVLAERKMDSEMYENMIYIYKRYNSGSIAVIVDEKIDMRIIIKGEK